jgi:tryptophan synthase alpha chain
MSRQVDSSRIEKRFAELKKRGRKAFVAYITAGDPDLKTTKELVKSFDRSGVDIVELGVPFSDPLADGVVNQLAADRALQSGTTLPGILRLVRTLREEGVEIPIVLFTYFNPIHRFGLKKFVTEASSSGVDGILNLDLPPEEGDAFEDELIAHGIAPIYLVAPTTSGERLARIGSQALGFIYYVSREGVTGMQSKVAKGLNERIRQIRRISSVPIVIGFGISTPEQVKEVAGYADGCVVGSAIVDRIGKLGKARDLVPRVSKYVASLTRPLRG